MRANVTRTWLPPLVLGALGVGAAGCHPSDRAKADSVQQTAGDNASPPAPLVHWIAGDSYTYRVELSSTSQNDASSNAVEFTATAALRVRPHDVAGATEFYAELLDVKVEVPGDGGAPLPSDLKADLTNAWGFELVDGSFHALRARSADSPFAIGILNTLAAGLQSPMGVADAGAWEHAEADATGPYRARYAAGAEPGEVTRVKTAYGAHPLSGSKLPFGRLDLSPTIVASQGTLRLRAGDLFAVRTHDELDASLTVASKVHSVTDLSLTLVDHGSSATAPGTADWGALRASTVVLQPGQVLSRPGVDPYDLKLAEGTTFAQALAAAEKESTPAPGSTANPMASSAPNEDTAREREHTFSTLVALVRTRPGTVPLAVAAIDKGSSARPLLLDALGSAATPEALSALVGYARRATLPEAVRTKAAFALIRTSRPTAATVDALIALLSDPLLRSYAIVGLGTYCRRLREAGNVDQANRAMDAVLPLLDAAKDRPDRVEILQGIANSGDGRAFGRVRPFIDEQDEAVRAAAVDAIRLMPNPEVDGLVASRMAPAEKVPVRLEAIDAARLRGAHDPLVAAVQTAATDASDSESRLKAVHVLERWMPERPEVRATLERVARDDSREAVRRAAKAALGT